MTTTTGRRRGAWLLGCSLLFGVVALVPNAPAARADEPAPSKVLVVSGSSLAAIRWYGAAKNALQGAQFDIDLESCRRTNGVSCKGREGRIPPTVLSVVKAKGAGHDTLIVWSGYNESTKSLSKGFDLVVATARAKGITRILWTTLRVNVDYISPSIQSYNDVFVKSNAMLRAKLATGKYPDVTLVDWNTYSTNETSWFVTDGVHFTVSGAWAAADYLSRKLAFLENRACPVARRAGEEPQNPCPDPDASPPDVDLVSLYPIDPNELHCYEVGADRHIECRPDVLVGAITDTLRYGMQDHEVKALEQRLAHFGYLPKWAVDKKFDKYTFLALLTYQERKGIPISGVAGPGTRAALGFGCPDVVGAIGSSCPPDGEPMQMLVPVKAGAVGIHVRLVQQRLADLGYFTAKIDGRFRTSTGKALKAFQKANALTPTGIIDAPTVGALGWVAVPIV